jgi:hypothetical protein
VSGPSTAGGVRGFDWTLPYCLGTDQTIDAAALLYSGGQLVGFTGTTGIPVVNNAVADIIQLPAFTNVATADDLTVSVSSPLPGAPSANVSALSQRDTLQFLQWTNILDLSGGSGDAVLEILPSSFADFIDVRAYSDTEVATDIYAESRWLRRFPSTVTSTSLVLTDDMLPLIRAASVDVVDGNLEISWLADADLGMADGASLDLEFYGPAVYGRWQVLFPAQSGSSFRLSALPKALDLTNVSFYVWELGFFDYDYADYREVITTALTYGSVLPIEGRDIQGVERLRRQTRFFDDD